MAVEELSESGAKIDRDGFGDTVDVDAVCNAFVTPYVQESEKLRDTIEGECSHITLDT